MAKTKQNVGSRIIGTKGQILHIETRMNNIYDNKYYAIVAMCGHAGTGFFVPVLFSVAAKDQENAIAIIKASPRVKNAASRCILCIGEISLSEFDFIGFINSKDSYLTGTQAPDEKRKVLSHTFAEVLMKSKRKENLSTREKVILEDLKHKKIRYAESYPDTYVLQRAFAPTKVNGKIIYPRKVDMDELLYEYFKYKINYLGLEQKFPQALRYCLQIFGLENEFGVTLDQENNTANFIDENGEMATVELTEKAKTTLLLHQEFRLRTAIKKIQGPEAFDIPDEMEQKIKSPSAIDRFNSRWNKSKPTQNTDDTI